MKPALQVKDHWSNEHPFAPGTFPTYRCPLFQNRYVRVASHLGAIPRSVDDRRKIRGGGILSDLAILLCLFLQRFGDMLFSKTGVPLP
jgi:hypothetical protein